MTAPQPRFGRYEVTRSLGAGAVTTVYRAFDQESRREFALKALNPEPSAQADLYGAFTTAARAMQGLRHPNLVTVFDVDQTGGRPFFTMELVRGRTLRTILQDAQRMPFGRLVETFRSVCAAVDYLHRGGVTHGAIGANAVMVKDSGRALLMDLDVTGRVSGPADDIRALGLLAYQLVAGVQPTEDPGEETLRRLQPGLPETVYQTIGAALSPDPDARPGSAGEIATAVAAAAAVLSERESSTATLPLISEGRRLPRIIEPARTLQRPLGPLTPRAPASTPVPSPAPTVPPQAAAIPPAEPPARAVARPPAHDETVPVQVLDDRLAPPAPPAPLPAASPGSGGKRWLLPAVGIVVLAAVLAGGALVLVGRSSSKPATAPRANAGAAAVPSAAITIVGTLRPATATSPPVNAPTASAAPIAPVASATPPPTPVQTTAAAAPPAPTSAPVSPTPAGGTPTGSSAAGVQQVMLDNRFSPAELTEFAGRSLTVAVMNRGSVPHNFHVTSLNGDDGREIKTDLLNGGESATITFTISTKGTYSYRCDVHPDEMRGVLTVQ